MQIVALGRLARVGADDGFAWDGAETSDLGGLSSLGEDARRAFTLDDQLQALDARMPVDIVRERDG